MLGRFFYDERQSLDGVASFSPSAGKPAAFMSKVKTRYFWDYTHMRGRVHQATRDDLLLVHDKHYVDGVLCGTVPNGFGNTDPRVPEACLWMVGSLASAALAAHDDPLPLCSPTSGFHHAGHAFGGGYCTFNGLAVAAAKFLQAHPDSKVAILDCDMHYGDGTADILEHKPGLARRVLHFTSGAHFHDGDDPDEFFLWLQESIDKINAAGCGLVLYQAGADMHVNDPLGGLLDDAQMKQRDRTVFRKTQAPLVWNLAGGYRKGADGSIDKVIDTHMNTLAEANMSDATRSEMFRGTPPHPKN